MSRRDYDRYDDRQNDYRRPPRSRRDYNELDVDVDIKQTNYDAPAPARRAATRVAEREQDDVSTTSRRRPRQPDFLREDYGRNSNVGELVVRTKREDDDYASRVPPRKRSLESVKSRQPPQDEWVEEDTKIVYKERERSRAPPYPQSDRGGDEEEEIVFKQRDRTRARPERTEENIDIRIREDERINARPARREYVERDDQEIRFTRSRGIPAPPEVEKEEIIIKERDRGQERPRRNRGEELDIDIDIDRRERDRQPTRGRGVREEEIDINIRESSAPAPRQRSMSRGALVRKDREEWVVRKKREPSSSPSPSPPPRDYEKEEIIVRRKIRTPSPEPEPEPEPPREPSPEPPKLEPIYRPPIIQEVITHHRYIDHPVERAKTPEPPPAAPSPPSTSSEKEEDLEISIHRKGMRNGKAYDEEIDIDIDLKEGVGRQVSRRDDREESKEVNRRRSVSASTRGGGRQRYDDDDDDDVGQEADYYNRKVSSRGYPGEAYNGATRDWGLVDIPPGTERVAMDGIGGGREEVTWDRYAGQRHAKFYAGDRVYDSGYGNGGAISDRRRDDVREKRSTETRITQETNRGKTRDKMWTEVSKDLVGVEAIREIGYEYEESEAFYYVMEYLRYEDVLKLVEITEDIRRERAIRLREIAYEREQSERPRLLPPPLPRIPPIPRGGGYEERVYEKEYRRYR